MFGYKEPGEVFFYGSDNFARASKAVEEFCLIYSLDRMYNFVSIISIDGLTTKVSFVLNESQEEFIQYLNLSRNLWGNFEVKEK